MISACILTWSLTYGIDPSLTKAIISHESNYNESAVGLVGEIGLMQIRPEYVPESRSWLFKGCNNIKRGVQILKNAMKNCKHQTDNTWILCFNAGLAGGAKIKNPKAHPYYKAVMANYRSK